MRKAYKRKKCCCAMCKPYKRGGDKRWKNKDFERLRRFERDRQRGWLTDE